MERFALVKWYLDCVGADGRSAVVYSTVLTWGPARVNWHGFSLHEPGRPPVHRSSLAVIDLPGRQGEALVWDAVPLGCRVASVPSLAPFGLRLLDQSDGTMDWQCEAPAARVSMTLADRPPLEGLGYAERLELSVLPWRLPIEDLRWGRFVSDDGRRSVVWVDWGGPQPRTEAFVDGQLLGGATVTAGSVRAGEVVLEIGARTMLHRRPLSSALAGISRLLSLMPEAWRGVEDTKWLSRARLAGTGLPAPEGWCIDELVRFPR